MSTKLTRDQIAARVAALETGRCGAPAEAA